MARFLGCARNDLLGMTVKDIHLKEDLKFVMSRIDALMSGREKVTYAVPFLRKDKTIVYLDVSVACVVRNSTKIIVAFFQDVTRAKLIENEANSLKRQMDFILDVTGVRLDIIDSDYNIVYVDPRWRSLYGNFAGKKCYNYFMGRNKPCIGCGVPTAIATKSKVVTEEVLVRENNRPIEVITIPFRDDKGKWFVAEINLDISERAKMEGRLREFEQKYKSIVDGIGIGIAIISPKMEIVSLNKQMRRWFPNVDVLNQPICYEAYNIPSFTRPCSYCPVIKTFRDGKIHEAITNTPYRGKIINYRIISSPVVDNNGRIIAVVEIVEDITERKKTEAELLKNQKILLASQRQSREFSRQIILAREEERRKIAVNLHDELGSTATAINSVLDVAQEDIREQKSREAIEAIDKARRYLMSCTSSLKKMAADLRPANLDIVGLAEAVKTFLANAAQGTGLKINFQCNLDKKPIGDLLATALYRMIQEAVTNIVKHSRASAVKVTLFLKGRRLVLRIRDNGRGFNVEKLDGKEGALKIGIKGMRERVEATGGKMLLKSTRGKGTSIEIVIPNVHNSKK